MKKILSIISAILIALASLGFLLIPQLFEFRISKLKDENESIISQQRDASEFVHKAISSRLNYAIFQDNLDLFRSVSRDSDKIKKKEANLIFTSASSAQNALNAAIATKKIDQEMHEVETKKILEGDFKLHKEYYEKYIAIAAEATSEIDIRRSQNIKRISDLVFWKNALWYFSFFIQSIGFALAIIALSTETDD